MDKELNNRLIDASYAVIREEKLPRPKDIRLRMSLYGTKSRLGTCIKFENDYKIIIYMTKVRFIECENGNLLNVKTGKKCRRGLGKIQPFKKIVEIMAHEIAHLKYWKHNTQHTSYTKHINDKLKRRLGLKE